MKVLKFTNPDATLNVDYRVDLIGDAAEFTVYQINQFYDGAWHTVLSDAAIQAGLFQDVASFNIGDFHTFATANNYTLQVLENGVVTETLNTATAFAFVTTTIKGGDIGVVDVQTLTLPTTAGATQGDYILITNWNGETVAAWLDIDADGTAPTGAKYLAADYQIQVPIVTAGTAADNGTAFYEAITVGPTIPGWTYYVLIVDNADGTVEFTQTQAGVTAAADPENEDDSGVGSITVAVDATGTGTGEIYAEQIEAEGGNTPYSYALTPSGTTDLPAGLTFNTTTGVLEGVPTEAKADAELDVTITDAFGVEIVDQFAFITATP